MAIKTKLMLYALASLAYISSPTLTAQSSGMSIDLTRETLISVETYYNLPSGLLTAICQVESGCNPYQVPMKEPTRKGDLAYGPFQIRTIAYREVLRVELLPNSKLTLMPSDLHSPAQLTAVYLKIIRKRCGNWASAISAYNTGKCLRMTRYNQKVIKYLPKATRRQLQKEIKHET